MSTTSIEWTDKTWNPLVGCSVISPGCTNCYAMRMAARLERIADAHAAKHDGDPGPLGHYQRTTMPSKAGPVWTGRVREASAKIFLAPLSWKTPQRIFVNSMSDLFHEDVKPEVILNVLAVMAMTYDPAGTDSRNVITGYRQRHIYQVLTKRAQRMQSFMSDFSRVLDLPITEQLGTGFAKACRLVSKLNGDAFWQNAPLTGLQWIEDGMPGLWLGVSAEDQQRANERIPLLLKTPAAKRFVSAEPLLGPLSLEGSLGGTRWIGGQRGCDGTHVGDGRSDCPRHPHHHHDDRCGPGLDWLIVGGESGPNARPMHPDWVRDLKEECQENRVAFFFKQWGAWAPGENTARTSGTVDTADWFGGVWTFSRENMASTDGHRDDEPDLYRVGKKEAGALLDGVLYREFPA